MVAPAPHQTLQDVHRVLLLDERRNDGVLPNLGSDSTGGPGELPIKDQIKTVDISVECFVHVPAFGHIVHSGLLDQFLANGARLRLKHGHILKFFSQIERRALSDLLQTLQKLASRQVEQRCGVVVVTGTELWVLNASRRQQLTLIESCARFETFEVRGALSEHLVFGVLGVSQKVS